MTIHEVVNAMRLQKLDMPFNALPGPREYFPSHQTDVTISEDGELVIAINRVTGRFAAQKGETCILGFADVELLPEDAGALTRCSESQE